MRFPSFTALLLVAGLGCTDAGLYAVGDEGPTGPDRSDFVGTACVPLAGGETFPVKVLFALQGGDGVDRAITGQLTEALQALTARFSVPYVRFGLIGFHTVATGLEGAFVRAPDLAPAIAKYGSYQESGPVSLRAPLALARSLLSGDMQTGCRGAVARTRYLVVLVVASKDTACANPAFNAGIDDRCIKLLPDEAACSQCELTGVAGGLKVLADRFGAGEVSVQPVYVRTAADPIVSRAVAAIARQGGTEPIETDPANLQATLNSLNYASLQRSLTLKRLFAFNRNALAREGKLLPDSDGDGLDDALEGELGSDPTNADTDADGLMDGLERRMGLDPVVPDPAQVSGCNPFLDTDGDRLNDCEERLVGTDPCISDSDGDSLPDLVELLSGTNPLVAENVVDDDRDGLSNIEEVAAHTDPRSADVAFRVERGYGYSIREAAPTEDGRACFELAVHNVGLVPTLARPNPPFGQTPQGTNDIYLYLQVGRPNDPRGTGIGSLRIEQIQFLPPARKRPKGTIAVSPEEFVLGN